MTKKFALIAALSISLSGVALGASYKLDDKGKCRDDQGKFAKAALCVQHTYKLDDKKKCRDEKGHFAKAELCRPN